MKRLKWAVLSFMWVLISCSKSEDDPDNGGNNTQDCSSVSKSFANNVGPLIMSTCTNSDCHGAGSINGPGPLLTYNQIFAARVLMRSAISTGLMPKNSSLTTVQKNMILCWIDSGAPNN